MLHGFNVGRKGVPSPLRCPSRASKEIDGSFVFFGSKVDLKPRSGLVVDHRLTQITHGMLFIRGRVVLAAKFAYARHERYIRPVYLKKSSPMLVQHGLKVCNILVSDVKMDHNANSVIGEVKHVNALGSKLCHDVRRRFGGFGVDHVGLYG